MGSCIYATISLTLKFVEFLLKNNIKYIEYDNVVETEGTSFVILDESELNNIEEYTFYEFLTMHYDKI